jgi:hypothetical protein
MVQKPTIRILVIVSALGAVSACNGGDDTTPTTPPVTSSTSSVPARVVETFDYVLVLRRDGYDISGPTFTISAGGPVDVRATFVPQPGFTFEIDLLYLGLEVPHNEGPGGPGASGPGPTLVGYWEVGYVGEFRARIYPLGARFPLPVPREGLAIPVTFTIEHP